MSRFIIDPDIAKAKTPDTGFYTDPALFEASKEKLFAAVALPSLNRDKLFINPAPTVIDAVYR